MDDTAVKGTIAGLAGAHRGEVGHLPLGVATHVVLWALKDVS